MAPCIPAGAKGMAWLCCSTASCSVARVLLLLTVDRVSPFRLSQAVSPKLTALPLMHSTENFRVQCTRLLYYPLQLCFPLRARVILFMFQCQVPQGLCICLLENMFCFDVCFSNGTSLHNTFCCKRMLNLQMSYHFSKY